MSQRPTTTRRPTPARRPTAILLAALLCLAASSAPAGPPPPEEPYLPVPDCAGPGVGLVGLMRMVYQEHVPPNRAGRVVSETCVSLDEGWWIGPERVDGFTKAAQYDAKSARYEVLTDSDTSPGRRRMSVSEIDWFPLESGPPIHEVTVWLKSPMMRYFPVKGTALGYGFLHDPAMAPLDRIPPGKWLFRLHTGSDYRWDQRVPPIAPIYAEFGNMWEVMDIAPDGTITPSGLYADDFLSLSLSYEAGEIGGTFWIRRRNTTLPAARDADEFAYADLEIMRIRGRALKTARGPVMFGIGTGRTMSYNDAGETRADYGEFRFSAMPIPGDVEMSALIDAISPPAD